MRGLMGGLDVWGRWKDECWGDGEVIEGRSVGVMKLG